MHQWGCSSAGRALRSQCRGQGFDPPHLHQLKSTDVRRHPWIFFIFLSQPFGYRYLQSDSSIIRSSEDNQYANDSHSRMVFPIGKFSYGNHT